MVDRNYYSNDYYRPLLLFENKGLCEVLSFDVVSRVVDGVIMIIPFPTEPLTMFFFIFHHHLHHQPHSIYFSISFFHYQPHLFHFSIIFPLTPLTLALTLEEAWSLIFCLKDFQKDLKNKQIDKMPNDFF